MSTSETRSEHGGHHGDAHVGARSGGAALGHGRKPRPSRDDLPHSRLISRLRCEQNAARSNVKLRRATEFDFMASFYADSRISPSTGHTLETGLERETAPSSRPLLTLSRLRLPERVDSMSEYVQCSQ